MTVVKRTTGWNMNKTNLKISATDLKQWSFCPRQWYFYKTTGRKPKFNRAIKRGLDYHRAKGEAVDSVIKAQRYLVFFLKTGGSICLLLVLLYWLFLL